MSDDTDIMEQPEAGARPDLHPAVAASIGRDDRYITPRRVRVIRSHRYETPVFFTINNPEDRIHASQSRGRFYEEKVLQTLRPYFPEGGTFLDAGANIGNHSLYMLLFGGAARVIPFEVHPDAISLYCAAMILNGVDDRVSLETLGYGLHDTNRDDAMLKPRKGNLGWTKVDPDQEGDLALRTGDSLVGDSKVDFIKMDVEGLEVAALRGLAETIRRDRPPIFVEVDNRNREAFDALMAEWEYDVAEAFAQNRINQNLLLLPRERAGEAQGGPS